MNPSFPAMYNMPNMGMINSNSMMNYTYLNSNYQNYHSQPQQGYNTYMPTNPTNKFSSNNIYSPQTPNPNQLYNNVYQNKIPNQMPMNIPGQTMPMASAPVINNVVPNPNISANASPSISTLSHTSAPLLKDLNVSNVSASTATSHNKKPINLEAQSFIPKKLKKPSISSEKDLHGLTPKKEAVDATKQINHEFYEKEKQTSDRNDLKTQIKNETPTPIKEILSPSKDYGQNTPITKKPEEKKEKTRIKDQEIKQSPENFSLDKKEAVISSEEKLSIPVNNTVVDTNKPKPKTLLASILSQPPTSNVNKPTEKTVINTIPSAASNKKKTNEVTKAFEEKAKDLKEQEKLKKEEKLKNELKQKQASLNNTPTSAKKLNKETSRKAEKKEEKEERPIEIAKEKKEDETKKLIEEPKEKEEKEKQEQINPIEEKQERKIKIEKIYFKVYEDEQAENIKNRYAYEYLFSFRNWKICYETKLVEDLMTGHFKNLKETVEEVSSNRNQNRVGNENKGGFGKRGTKFRDEPIQPKISNENATFQRSKIEFKQPEPKETPSTDMGEGLGKWGRKDLSKEEKLASDFKNQREEQIKKDPARFKFTE